MEVEILADSINSCGKRLTTFRIVIPRYLLPELNTHRAFSRNSASSRAKPISVTLKQVMENPFVPEKWMKQHKGMQGNTFFTEEQEKELKIKWLAARDAAVASVQTFLKVDGQSDVTKQIVNRLLEPFLYQEIVLSATDWDNFFAVRNHPDAEFYMQKLAQMILEEYKKSSPKKLRALEWHIPFSDKFDETKLKQLCEDKKISVNEAKLHICTARCARVSYGLLDDETKYDYNKDYDLCKSLVESGHWSPLEHCAYAEDNSVYVGNFCGFVQYRKIHAEENRTYTY